jgi:hypothetical protein
MRRRHADEPIDVRIAADDAVHDDDVVRPDGLLDEVGYMAVDTLAQPAFGEERCRLLLVLAGQLDVSRAGRAGGQELELDTSPASSTRPREVPPSPRFR